MWHPSARGVQPAGDTVVVGPWVEVDDDVSCGVALVGADTVVVGPGVDTVVVGPWVEVDDDVSFGVALVGAAVVGVVESTAVVTEVVGAAVDVVGLQNLE